MQDHDLTQLRQTESLRFGSKYELSGSHLLASSSSLGWGPGFTAELCHHDEELDCPPFFQPVNEVAIAIRGSALVHRRASGPEQTFSSSSGIACLCPRGVDVRYLHVASGSVDTLHLYLPTNLFGLLEIEDDSVQDVGLNYLAGVRDPLITQIGRTIGQELTSGTLTRASNLLVESLGVALTAHLVERYAQQGQARSALAKSFHQVRGGLDSRRLTRVIEFVHAHVGANISLDAMAQEACLSRFHFARAFRQSTGLTPLAYVTAVRIARAKELLQQTSSTIEDIALALNFSCSSNFVRTFRREVGVTPSAYRTRR
ncbi:helix-turn-helix domain-containing protein [Paraburkholderia silviterrae]|uniref:AraC family transcriptional regulator n=1 Tax=Paraburkholderia silviterrae TaxID=2528715 RepID=A0A4R5M462_9BURK|nr:AraC family transcriptional regulator [Paraburkholderia silviterrae]TDG20522.1 AraC family transcriptional regulator [Paraburkholderia silviterrae]